MFVLKRLMTLALLITLPASVLAQRVFPDTLTFTILHTNDLHGHLLPFAYTEVGRGNREVTSVGGAAKRATLIRKLRREIKNPTLLVDSGDTFTRGPLTNAYEGIADAEAMNAVGYDLAAIGNNEFKAKDGIEENDAAGAQNALLQVIKRSRFAWLCANAKDGNGAFLEGVQPYVVREIGGIRVGFLGLTAPRVATYPQAVGWTITDPIAAAKEWIPKARQHCDILIAITHIGVMLDSKLAAQTTGLDAIVGGDTHTFLYKAVETANLDGKKIPIVQDGEFGVNLGRFDLHLQRGPENHWTLASYDDKLIPVGANLKEAPDVAAVLQPYVQSLLAVVGHLDKVGATPTERTQITNRVIADALRQQSGADYALRPADSGFEVFRHKDVTRYDVFAIEPFKNHVVTANLTGATLQAMQKAVPTTVVSGDMAHLDPTKNYKVAFVDYASRTAYKLLREETTDTGQDERDVIFAYLSRKPTTASAKASALFAPAIALQCALEGEKQVAKTVNVNTSAQADANTAKRPFVLTKDYATRVIEGWTVHVNRHLLTDNAELGTQALRLLEVKLYDIKRVVPERAFRELQKVPLWLGVNDGHAPCSEYHPNRDWLAANGYNPDKAKCVEIGNARNFVDWSKDQPFMVLHELAHAYHDRVLGFDNADIQAAYQHAVDSGIYDSVLRNNGKMERAYALTDAHEYFAEATEAFFGTNDFYPFVRPELERHDPRLFKILQAVWNK